MSNQFKSLSAVIMLGLLASCMDASYVQKESPTNAYKEYDPDKQYSSIIGVGTPMSASKIRANALISLSGKQRLEHVMDRFAKTYNVAVRWGDGTRRNKIENLLMKDLAFDEARAYLEDVYNIQMVREGERRMLLLPSVSEPRVAEFAPGRNVTLSQAINGLSQQCGFNVVIAENKARLANTRVTTRMKDITCYDAFAALLNPQGLSLEDKGGYYSVSGFPTRQWALNLHEPERDDERTVEYASSVDASGDENGSSQTMGGTSKVSIKNERRLWEELKDDLDDLLESACTEFEANTESGGSSSVLPPPTGEGDDFLLVDGGDGSGGSAGAGEGPSCGYVRVNKDVGLVQMRAPHHILEEADEVIRKIEDVAGRRLVLEARVLAVKKERNFEQGGNISNAKIGGTENTAPSAFSIASLVNQSLIDMSDSATGLRTTAQIGSIEAAVRIVESFGTTYQLMQPTIELMDRQQATLIDGTNEPFVIRTVEEETDESGNTTQTFTSELNYQFFGMQFSASAQIAEEGEPHTISIQIPIISEKEPFSLETIYNNGADSITDQIPVAETRLIDQKVRLRDGEIKVIGGLTKTMAIDSETGVPLLRDMPVVGKTMNSEDITYEKVEFVVLLQARRIY